MSFLKSDCFCGMQTSFFTKFFPQTVQERPSVSPLPISYPDKNCGKADEQVTSRDDFQFFVQRLAEHLMGQSTPKNLPYLPHAELVHPYR